MYQTPFLIGSSYMYQDYAQMQTSLAHLNQAIREGGLPRKLTPMVYAVTGTGRVAQGSIEVLEQLPHVKVPPSEQREWLAKPENANNKKQIVILILSSGDISRPIDNSKTFSKQDNYANLEEDEGYFH